MQDTQSPGRVGYVGTESEGLGTPFEIKHRNEAFGLLASGVRCGAILSEGKDGGGAHTRDRLDKSPPGFRGGRQV